MLKTVWIYTLDTEKELCTDPMLSSLDHVASSVHRWWNDDLHGMFHYHGNFPWLSHVMWQMSGALYGNWCMGDGERKQTNNPFVACLIVTQLLWFGFVTVLRSLLVYSSQNSNKKTFKTHKVKTLFFREGKDSWRSHLPAMLDRKASDPKQISTSLEVIWKQAGSCAAVATQCQLAMAHT